MNTCVATQDEKPTDGLTLWQAAEEKENDSRGRDARAMESQRGCP
jgi:hypothetical protein